VSHPRTGTVREYVKRFGVGRPDQQRRHALVADLDAKLLYVERQRTRLPARLAQVAAEYRS
jgi:hypothetical protein